MLKKNSGIGCSPGTECGCAPGSGCKVEAVLSVDERGQMVLPKDVREKDRDQNRGQTRPDQLGEEWQCLLPCTDESREPE